MPGNGSIISIDMGGVAGGECLLRKHSKISRSSCFYSWRQKHSRSYCFTRMGKISLRSFTAIIRQPCLVRKSSQDPKRETSNFGKIVNSFVKVNCTYCLLFSVLITRKHLWRRRKTTPLSRWPALPTRSTRWLTTFCS